MKSKLALLIASVALLGACSTSIDIDDNGNGTCTQERSKQFLGITYTKNQNFVNCDSVGS